MRIGQTSAIVFLSKVISSALGFVATLYLARVLGAEVLGYYALTMAVVAWLRMAGNFGIGGAMTKRISEGGNQGAYAAAGFSALAIFVAVISAAVLLTQDQISGYIGADVVPLVVSIRALGVFYSGVDAVVKANKKVHISGMIDAGKVGTRSVFQIAVVAVGFGLGGILFGQVVAYFVGTFLLVASISISLSRPTKQHFVDLYDYAKYSWLGKIESRSYNDIDTVVLGLFVSPTLVGIYSVSWKLSQFLTVFGGSIRQAVFPEISHHHAEGNNEAVETLLSDTLTYGGLFLIPGVVGGTILGTPILSVYGSEFERGSTILALLLLATLFHGYHNQMRNCLNALDCPGVTFRINAIFIVFNVIANLLLIAQFGWIGAAVATTTSTGLSMIVTYWALQKRAAFRVPWEEIGRQAISAGMMAGVLVIGLEVVRRSSTIGLRLPAVFSLVITGSGIYFVVLTAISTELRSTLKSNLPDRVPLL